MAVSNDDGGGGDGQVWDGYSDYRTISSRIGRNIFDAIDSYAYIHSLHAEHARVKSREAATHRAQILSAALTLKPEIENQEGTNEELAAILERWEGGTAGEDVDVEVPDQGFIAAFSDLELTGSDPGWLYQFVIDIRRAGWELGYLKAGRHEETGTQEFEPTDVTELLNS